MKVILLNNVRKVGQKGEMIEVSDGFGRNFLIKNGLAKIAAGGSIKEVENKKKVIEKKQTLQAQKELEKFEKINESQIKIKVPANENGGLFGAIKKNDIASEVGLKKDNIILNKDIKELGQFEVKIKIGKNQGKIFLVVAEK